MNGNTHKAAGLAASLGVSMIPAVKNFIQGAGLEEGLTLTVVFMLGSVAGSYLSDIDDETSTISNMFPFISKLITKNYKKINAFRHRHFFHSIGFALPFFLLAFFLFSKSYIAASFASGLGVGILSHIFSDWVMSETYILPFIKHGFSLFHLEGKPKAQATLDKAYRYLVYATNVFLVLVRFQ